MEVFINPESTSLNPGLLINLSFFVNQGFEISKLKIPCFIIEEEQVDLESFDVFNPSNEPEIKNRIIRYGFINDISKDDKWVDIKFQEEEGSNGFSDIYKFPTEKVKIPLSSKDIRSIIIKKLEECRLFLIDQKQRIDTREEFIKKLQQIRSCEQMIEALS